MTKKMFPREFVEWIFESDYFWGQLSECYMTLTIDLPSFNTLDEAYKYWLSEIKNK